MLVVMLGMLGIKNNGKETITFDKILRGMKGNFER